MKSLGCSLLGNGLYLFANRLASNFSGLAGFNLNKPIRLLDAQVTARCNLRCRQCPIWSVVPGPELDTDQWKKIFLDVKKFLGPYFLRFYGGEPFLRKDILDLLHFCTDQNIKTIVTTNGTLIGSEEIAALIKNKTFVQISLDGIYQRTHDYLRGVDGTYARVLDVLESLRGRTAVQLNTTLMDPNIEEILPLADFASQKKVYISFSGLVSFVPGDERLCGVDVKHPLFPKESERVLKVIDCLVKAKRKNPWILNSEISLNRLKFHYKGTLSSKKKGCEAKNRFLVVRRQGDLYSCPFFLLKEKALGNLCENNLETIWRSKKAFDVLEAMGSCPGVACLVMRGVHKTSLIELWRKYRYCRRFFA